MIVGDKGIFAVESSITEAYERLSLRALGFFSLHVGGRIYGRQSPDSTMLACSFDEVTRRIGDRGNHSASFSKEDAGSLAGAVLRAIYSESDEATVFFGLPAKTFSETLYERHLVWAPDGDEAFDDGSYVLQFDVGDHSRVIGFRSDEDQLYDPQSLADVWLPSDSFYAILEDWRAAFEREWRAMPRQRA